MSPEQTEIKSARVDVLLKYSYKIRKGGGLADKETVMCVCVCPLRQLQRTIMGDSFGQLIGNLSGSGCVSNTVVRGRLHDCLG